MAENSAIEWCDHTFNPWEGCQKVGPGCDHCYAETRNARFGGGAAPNWGPTAPRRRTSLSNWRKPLRWQADAAAFHATHGRQQRVFCASLADVFDNHRSIDQRWRTDLAALVLATPSLEWLFLTKRIGNALNMLIEMFPNGAPPNLRIGATVVNQDEWNRDRRKIAQVMVATERKPFLSMEPLRGRVDLETDPAWNRFIGWVIVGGESGRSARTMHPDWVVDLHDQCQRGQVPFLFKQWGDWQADQITSADPRSISLPVGHVIYNRVGKKAAGRQLFGVEHNGFPL